MMKDEHVEKLLYELRRIGNAVEMLAMTADEHFTPMDQGLMQYLRDRNRRNRSRREPTPPGPVKPKGDAEGG
jgi:hypothetical protein